ncbi:MAG: hypothetical protein SF162_04285 [bacterium]|nr:hypothetical protein [bacterium]
MNTRDKQHLKPPRPLGLSLAILLSIFLFTVLPLAQLCVLFSIQYRASQTRITDANGAEAIAFGGNFGGISTIMVITQAVLGIVFLGIAIFAWHGRPTSIRHVMNGSVLLLTLFYVWDNLAALFVPTALAGGIDSGAGLRTALQCVRLFANLLIPLYTLWYMNRGPARAFFQGHYRPAPAEPPAQP